MTPPSFSHSQPLPVALGYPILVLTYVLFKSFLGPLERAGCADRLSNRHAGQGRVQAYSRCDSVAGFCRAGSHRAPFGYTPAGPCRLGPAATHAHDSGLLAVGTARKLHTTGSRLSSRCRAALSASPLAPYSPPSGRSPRRAAQGAGCRPALAPGPPLPPAAPLVANRGARPGLRASAPGTERARHAGGPVARPPSRPGPSRRSGGAHTTGPQSLGRSRGGWPPTMPRGAADARPALACARSPGPAPAAPAGRQLRTRRGPPPLLPRC